ncbi:MAG TPA: tetratricopeptide repeat protein [Kofleriaceae bacterium]
MAPAAMRTDVVASLASAEVGDITRTVEPPDAEQLVGRMLELVASESEALLLGDDADGRLADLNVRTALASWDALHQTDEAVRFLELAERHPLAPRLRFAAALAGGEDALLGVDGKLGDDPRLAIELAEAWLWRYGQHTRAANAIERAVRAAEPALMPQALEIAVIANMAAGRWDRVLELRMRMLPATNEPEEVAATAALMLDRADNPAGALKVCWEKLEFYPGPGTRPGTTVDGTALGWLRVFDVAIEAATIIDDERKFELLDKRAELLSTVPNGGIEALATRFAVANELERDNEHAQVAQIYQQLAEDPSAAKPGAARHIAQLRLTWSTAGAKDRAACMAAHRALSKDPCKEVATAHAWRALELAAVLHDNSIGELARIVADNAGSASGDRWLDIVELSAPTPALITRFERRGSLRWAAYAAERQSERARAIGLWQRAAEGSQLPSTRDHLVRLYRGPELEQGQTSPGADALDALAEAYAACARSEKDPRSAAALWCARGIVDLGRGDFIEAEDSLRKAAELGPRDPFARAALAAVYRASRRLDALAQILSQLASTLTSKDGRAQAAREHAELLDEAGDRAGATAALEQMIAERPDDVDALVSLAKLCEREQNWSRAIELRTRAAEHAQTPAKRTEILTDIARLHRKSGGAEKALAIVREELATNPSDDRRLQLQREIAELLTELNREPEGVVAAYLDILAVEPNAPDALAGIEAPARRLGLWDELARAFRGAPATARNLEVLAEALTKISEWSELADVRRKQLEAAATTTEKAQRARDLASLYEKELGDADAAIRMLTIAQAAQSSAPESVGDLVRLLRSRERWPELAAALERELATMSDKDRQTAILRELGELRATKLNRASDAIAAYEGVIERVATDAAALVALEGLYEKAGRDRDLARILEARAEASTDLRERSALFARVATLRTNRGDVEGALAAFTAAFAADPTNRDVFTAMERVCYKAERWAAAMQLYESAIQHVESGVSRAYRLGDLYSRRGNVQMNFLGQMEEAVASYQKVVEVDSQPQAAVKLLEDLCARRNDWQLLIAAYEKRAEYQKDPTRKADALRAASQLVADHMAGDKRASLRIQRKLLTVDPVDAEAVANIEQLYEDEQDKTGLVDVLKMRLSAARDKQETVELLKRIARVSEEGARDVDTATEHYNKLLELQPDSREALDALSRIYETTEQWAEYIDVTRKLIKVTNDRNTKALLYFRCGSVMEAKFAREQDAIRYYDAAIKTSAACMPAVHGLRDLYRRREEWPRVIESLELEVKLWQDDKERAGVFAQIGRIWEKQLGDVERAMNFYESALTVDPDCLPANQALFEHFYDKGEWAKAQPLANALAQKAMREGDPTTRSDFYRRRGVVARMTGDPRAAAESFIVALEIKPTNSDALDELGALVRDRPDAWDFEATYRELDKLYKKRDDAGPLLARVHVGRARITEREGDLDAAAALYRIALDLAPGDFTVLSALVDFHADVRHWSAAVEAIEQFVNSAAASPVDRLRARMRLAQIHGDGEMNAERAINVLRDVIQTEPGHQDAYYLLAQQYFLVGKQADARAAIDRVIELATAPGQALIPAALARYYYYKGRILDAAGDLRSAAPQYRRAIEYDPGYAPPALVLARRAADAGDQRTAESLLIEAAHAAMAQGGPSAAVPLQRGLARILLASGDRPAAIEAYRGILAVDGDSPSDRVALAEIYAVDDLQRAIAELRKVIDRDIHHAPAYRLLASFYSRLGDAERATRVLTALELLGFSEEADRASAMRLRGSHRSEPLRRPMDDANRDRLLVTPAAREPLGEVFAAFAEPISALLTQPLLGENLAPASSAEPRLAHLANELGFLYQVEAEVFVGERVPGGVAITAFPSRMLVVDRALLAESDQTLRFLFGYAYEAIRGGYATVLQLGARQRRELAILLRGLLSADAELAGAAADLVNSASDEAHKVLEKHAGIRDVDADAWIDGMFAAAKRAGLVACNDFNSAIWAVARLSGEQLGTDRDTVALGSVLGGADLVRFYLSDAYQQLRDALTSA